MKVALFSDIHGHLRPLLQVMRNWQVAHQTFLDGVLQAGDLGCFPDLQRADSATQKHMKSNPEEAGFSRFFVEHRAEISAFFEPSKADPYEQLKCPICFVAGNHEDYEHLWKCDEEGPPGPVFPVDCYDAFHCLRDGAVLELAGADGAVLRVGGLWGIGTAKPGKPYVIDESSVQRLQGCGRQGFDLLLTHDAACGGFAIPEYGAEAIADIIHEVSPAFHLFGHVHAEGRHEFQVPGTETESWILNDLVFGKNQKGNLAETMAILDWDGAKGRVELVQDGWLAGMNAKTWRSLTIAPGSSL